jgi:TonB family protein
MNNRSRMLIAVFLAAAIHIGLMNFEFVLKPVRVTKVSLPRSVSVFLGQKKVVEKPVMQTGKRQTAEPVFEEQPAAETEPEQPVRQEVSTVKENPINQLQQSVLHKKTVRQPVVEKLMPASKGSESIEEDLVPEADEAAKRQKSAVSAVPQAAQEHESVTLPGILQMAYPRYHFNTPPVYPGLARKRGQEGTVFLQVLVNREGRVNELEIETSSGFTLLDRAAVSSVKKWSFEPGRRGEERIPMWVRVPITFTLRK